VIREVKQSSEWDAIVSRCGGHPLQLWGWGEVKHQYGPWEARRLSIEKAGEIIGGAQILIRRIPRPFNRLFYIPRGPFSDEKNREQVLSELAAWSRKQGGVELKIEPGWLDTTGFPRGWKKSPNHILMSRTATLNLANDKEDLLKNMTKKTRQYIRKSEKSGVKICEISRENDIAKCLDIYRETAKQRGFNLHPDEYYYGLARLAGNSNRIYLAEKDGQPLSFLWNLRTPETEFELYGGVNSAGEELRSNYALKWHAIAQSKNSGTRIYDMNGLLNDGVSNFKRGFAKDETSLIGTWDLPLSPLYGAWEKALPLGKKLLHLVKK
jgi:lipid II:glycine glycyltransferase (peptidoglycan interpeptide bridge formation enzyme)